MALLKEETQPLHIAISLKEWQEMSGTMSIIRKFSGVDDQYNDIKCPGCGLHMWIPNEENTKINCLACHHEFALCQCGEVLTEDKKSQNDTAMCVECWQDYCHTEKLCVECGKELIDDPLNKNNLACPVLCADPIPKATYWKAVGA